MSPLKELADTKEVDWKTHLVVETKDRKKVRYHYLHSVCPPPPHTHTHTHTQFSLPRDCVKMVGLIHDLLADSEEGMQVEMQLPEVDSDTLQCVWDYLEIYKHGDPDTLEKPLKVRRGTFAHALMTHTHTHPFKPSKNRTT